MHHLAHLEHGTKPKNLYIYRIYVYLVGKTVLQTSKTGDVKEIDSVVSLRTDEVVYSLFHASFAFQR